MTPEQTAREKLDPTDRVTSWLAAVGGSLYIGFLLTPVVLVLVLLPLVRWRVVDPPTSSVIYWGTGLVIAAAVFVHGLVKASTQT